MVLRNTTLVPSLGLRMGPACEVGLNAGMRRERVSPQRRKTEERNKERKKETNRQTKMGIEAKPVTQFLLCFALMCTARQCTKLSIDRALETSLCHVVFASF